MKYWTLAISLLAISMTSCEDYFGSKTNLDFIEVPNYGIREIAYVPIQPAFDGFVHPTDICIGFDELIYVVDAGTQEIICLDESGTEQGRFSVPGVKTVRQDRRLDLLAIGTHDTTINGVAYTLPAIYRINQTVPNGYGLNYARITHKTVHPFYFKSTFSTGDANAEFGQIAVLASADPVLNNRYYVTRRGTLSNNANQGPDQAVVLFDAQDQYVSPVSVTTSAGLFTNYFKQPQGIVSFAQPPQFTARAGDDFWFTALDANQELKVQQISLVETPFGADYKPVVSVPNPDRTDRWIGQPGLLNVPWASLWPATKAATSLSSTKPKIPSTSSRPTGLRAFLRPPRAAKPATPKSRLAAAEQAPCSSTAPSQSATGATSSTLSTPATAV